MHAYHLKYQSIGPCPFDKEIMNGTTKKPSVFGCSPRCGVHYLNDTPEIKQDYLNRFLELQKKGYYSKKHLYENGYLPPLLTKEEENEVEIVIKRVEKEFEDKWKVESALRLKTSNACDENKVVIHGLNKKGLPKELYRDIHKLIVENQKNIMFYSTLGDNIIIWDNYDYAIDKKCTLDNCSISLSIYYDYLNERKTFAFSIDNYPMTCNGIGATPELEKFNHRWKDTRKNKK